MTRHGFKHYLIGVVCVVLVLCVALFFVPR